MRPLPTSYLLPLGLAVMLCVFGAFSPADEAPSPKLPALKKSGLPALFYPAPARRLSQQGRVLVEFAISPKGRVVDASVTSADPRGVFDDTAISYVRALEFDVPADWESSGGPNHRYHFSFVFLFRPCLDTTPCEELAPLPADRSVTVTTPPLAPAPGH
jgi:TonB family protein